MTAECAEDTIARALKSNTPHLLAVTLAPVEERIRNGLRDTFKYAAYVAEWECNFAGSGVREASAVAVAWKNTTACTPDVSQLRYICDIPGDVPTGIPAEAAAFKVTIGEKSHIVAAVSRARDVGWTEKFSNDLRKLMVQEKVRWLGVDGSGQDDQLARAASAVFANVVSVAAGSHPFGVRSAYDESRAAVAADVFRIAGSELPSLLHAQCT